MLFQFHNGSIKSDNVRMILPPSAEFQFHNGSIKSESFYPSSDYFKGFQFHNGSIKRLFAVAENGIEVYVSIPQWFD